MSLSKTTKAAIWLQASVTKGLEEDIVMQGLSWIINGIDDNRIDWSEVLQEIKGEQEDV